MKLWPYVDRMLRGRRKLAPPPELPPPLPASEIPPMPPRLEPFPLPARQQPTGPAPWHNPAPRADKKEP
jgi:hypothetical protein